MKRASERRRQRALSAAPGQHRWLLSYADFVTLLFAVFVVLFAFAWKQKQPIQELSTVVRQGFDAMGDHHIESPPAVPNESASPATPTPSQTLQDVRAQQNQQLYDQLHTILGNSIDKREIVMQETPDGLVISLRELGFFASGDAKLLPGAADKIAAAAELLKSKGFEIRVEGHSDDQPIHSALYQSNWELSIARAMSVLRLLVDEAGFPENRISAAGYGPFRPVASNESPEGRRQNRRVDMVIVSPKTPPPTQPQ
jgi:chemotaxis protein MotB